jgi:hypothetical protein
VLPLIQRMPVGAGETAAQRLHQHGADVELLRRTRRVWQVRHGGTHAEGVTVLLQIEEGGAERDRIDDLDLHLDQQQ